ncbi:MAG: hypothetical protein LBQ62_02695 [Candidatus Accumulibacter sp.]|jgi:hypothetical protein|nr:hypothetical protein [Accumulibacter sp.]
MKKTITQCLVVFLWAISMGASAQGESLEHAEKWTRHALEAPDADGCAYSELLLYDGYAYRSLVYYWNGYDESTPLAARTPSRYLDFLDAGLKACSLLAGKDIPDTDPMQNTWLNRWLERFGSDSRSLGGYDAQFKQADALALAGPSVKDGVTRYWQKDGKTHIRFALNHTARDLRSWAKRRGIALQLTRQARGPVYNHDPITFRGKTAIPVFVVSPEGLTSAKIVAFAVGLGSNWLEVELSNDTTPPVWAVIALRDPNLAQKAKVTRQRPLETRKDKSHYLELKRGVLRLEFENDALPPLTLVARQLGFVEEGSEIGETENDWIATGEKTLLGSAWATEVFLSDPALEAPPEKEGDHGDPAFGRLIGFLGFSGYPPPGPE